MAEQIFIIEDGTLTKYEADDYVEVVYIPDCVKKISCQSFFEAVVGKVVLSDSVTTIEADAFLDCTLSEIEIPNSVTTIETWAFSGCGNLQSITIPDSVTSIGPWAIGYRELQFLPYWDPIPFGRPVIIYGKPGSEAERYTKDNFWRYNEHITEFREIRPDARKQEGEA
ncbi:leucine-rich repeat domain-containing protein [Eubacterium sp. am_0171]|uniref:leucine-rich repeat domain-containing protein n=1 Tax=unclassified Eubacterium (in: firmicutes) TaxID=2624479 RepID=UPI0010204D69|nr:MULTISPECIES: leucine-rich repeat domain-containing protein [unclassified Eubacterium (in: firmicutes)]MSC82793.1 leucine-rich repeat protein [Eubacterium sp. BIOML-A1]MSD05187.1 leucine-rich repeat protein [Eubacterium sp. BIOML-A2]RYT25083.1 leucine-rich repeat domain-containing protein [Eubacterium sp. am_0171]